MADTINTELKTEAEDLNKKLDTLKRSQADSTRLSEQQYEQQKAHTQDKIRKVVQQVEALKNELEEKDRALAEQRHQESKESAGFVKSKTDHLKKQLENDKEQIEGKIENLSQKLEQLTRDLREEDQILGLFPDFSG